jgi:hypothetical protein
VGCRLSALLALALAHLREPLKNSPIHRLSG